MNINYLPEPFPHLIIENFYDNNELEEIWEEIKFLTNRHKLKTPQESGSATEGIHGELKKSNRGIFLYDAYRDHSISNIIRHYRKIFNNEFCEVIGNFNFIFEYVKFSKRDSILLSYYEDGDYYKPHRDSAILTSITHFYTEPKQFEGGDLFFPDFKHNIPINNNKLILFPSIINHAVTDVRMKDDNTKFSGNGRYSLTNFIQNF